MLINNGINQNQYTVAIFNSDINED